MPTGHYQDPGASTSHDQTNNQESHTPPANNQSRTNQESGEQDSGESNRNSEGNFFMYEEEVVDEGIKQCTNSILGKLLTTKQIPKQVLYNSLMGIWCSIQELEFQKARLWIQLLGHPLHCKTVAMGLQLGAQLGTVEEAAIYDYPNNAKIIKIKVQFDINNPIRVGMYIVNENDGINWVDFRYENLPLFCFYYGLIGHSTENCEDVSSVPPKGTTNPRALGLDQLYMAEEYMKRRTRNSTATL